MTLIGYLSSRIPFAARFSQLTGSMGQGSSSTRSRPFDDEGYIVPAGNAAGVAILLRRLMSCTACQRKQHARCVCSTAGLD